MIKLKFIDLPEEFENAISRLCNILDYEIADDGIRISVKKADYISASLANGKGEICYIKKNHFFRALGLFIEKARIQNEFHVTEEPRFETVGVMLYSTGVALNVENIKKHLDYLAVMGYNLAMLYTEHNFEIETEPYFGYMDGRYTFDELKECDDYAFDYGIEMMPCIQTFGHLARFLKWPEVSYAKDTDAVILAGSEKTYELLDDIIKSASAPYRSNRIHLGMDEAWDMGRGAYMNKNGYVTPFEIFIKHLNRVIDITNKYNLVPMIWSDMFFRIGEPNHLYYEKETVIPKEIKKQIPKEVELVYWHYGEKAGCDEYMIEKHLDLNRNIIFSGGLWSWTGHLPENNYAFEMTKAALDACKKYGIKEMMTTVWGVEQEYSVLLGLSFTAEMAYTDKTDKEYLKSRFEVCTKGDYEAFWAMSAYHNDFENGKVYEDYNDRFAGMPLFYQDIMQGKADTIAYELKLSDHYKKYADIMSNYHGEWDELYRWVENLFKYLYIKSYIAENIKPSYDSDNREMLFKIANELLPELKEITIKIHNHQLNNWHKFFKGHNQRTLDSKYGNIIFRCDSCSKIINKYLNGEIKRIDELAEERLPYKLSGFPKYPKILE